MEVLKKLFDLLVALLKLGFTYLLDYFPRSVQKKFDPPVKKPQEAQSKNGVSEYISLKDVTLSEKDESRWRQEMLLKEYDFSETAEMNEFTLRKKN